VSIRRSTGADGEALARLAQLDGAAPPRGDYLLAEEDGTLRAAVSLAGGRPVADPFHRTADLLAMLELRLASLDGLRAPATSRRGLRLPNLRRRLAAARTGAPALPGPAATRQL
jgi:hypothetical protein